MLLTKNDILGTAKIIVSILPKGYVSTHDPNSQTSITIHNTANPNATAQAHIGAITRNNAGGRQASWHFTVDDVNIVQHIDTMHEAYHTGAGSKGNETSIGIEICEFTDPVRQAKAEDNAAALVRHLMSKIPSVSRVVQHNFWSGKDCPRVIRSRTGGWAAFLEKVYKEDTMNLKDDEVDFILSVLSFYWGKMKGNKDVQEYTHYIANRVREEAGRPKQ